MVVRTSFALLCVLGSAASFGSQPDDSLAEYFGFDAARIVVVDDGCGPVISADFNNDGRMDLAVVNNRKSRIELLYLRDKPRNESQMAQVAKANELPPNRWYDNVRISVGHRVAALRAMDADGDGKQDLVYTGSQPRELIIMRQVRPDEFEPLAKRRVRNLSGVSTGLEVADAIGDEQPEIVVLAGEDILVFPLDAKGELGAPETIGTGAEPAAFFIEDFNGDGWNDLLAVVPEDISPLRLWLQRKDPRQAGKGKHGILAAQLRFDMPGLREVEPARFKGRAAASIGVIERSSERMVFYDLATDQAAQIDIKQASESEHEVLAEATAFTDGSSKDRSVVLTDLDGDGLLDLIAANKDGNSVDIYHQEEGIGIGAARSSSTLKEPAHIVSGSWGKSAQPTVFVLSEEEGTVGVSTFDRARSRLTFPKPLSLATAGATPVGMTWLDLENTQALAIVVKQKRDYELELHLNDGHEPGTIKLTGAKRDPGSILAADADRDGTKDLLVFTPGEPMMMIKCASEDGAIRPQAVLTKDDMPQFGLVQAAGPDNTALFDIDGDGVEELLIADENFVRACSYSTQNGWSVVEQINDADSATTLVGLAVLEIDKQQMIVASDRAGGRLLILAKTRTGWDIHSRIRMLGFPVGPIYAGAFGGDHQPSILCLSDDSFALVRLGGQHASLEQFAAYRSDHEDRVEHEIEVGDVNGDGYVDLVVLDAGEQMCEIFTFSKSRKLHHATEFEVFDSRLFGRGDSREYQPSAALIADLTADGMDDVLLVAHDRLLIYPQMIQEPN